MGDRLSISVGIKFDTIASLQKEAKILLDKVGHGLNLKIGNIDVTNIDKTIESVNKKVKSLNNTKISMVDASSVNDINKIAQSLDKIKDISKYKVELMSDGQVKVAQQFNNELNQTVRTIKNLNTGSSSVSISGDIESKKKEAYSEIVKLQKTEYDLKNKLISADGEYARVLQEQLNYTRQLKDITLKEVNGGQLADEKLHNQILKERGILEDKLVLTRSKSNTNNINKMNQDLLKQNDYLDKNIAKLKIYQQSVDNKGGGKPTQQADLSGELTKQITKMEQLKNSNVLLGTAERNRINSNINDMRVQTNELVRYESSFSNLFKRIAMYAVGGSIIYSGISQVRKGIGDLVELDSAMRDLTKVAKATQEQLDGFTGVANKMAIEVGASTEAIIEATTYYSKLGYALDEASERAKNATVFANVGDMGIEDASKALITIQKGFNLNSLDDMTKIMDVANEVGNNFSSSTQDIAEGIRRMGNAMSEAGNSYEQTVGLFVAGNASIQNSETVGNAIKTIGMRLRGMKTEIDETSIPVSKLRDVIKQLTGDAGQMVDIMSDDNTFKSTYTQMTELAEVYPKLTDGQRAYLQYVIAGQRQGNILSGMMNNMTEGVNAYNTALNATGSAQLEQKKYMDSIEGKMNKFSETLKSVWVDAVSSDDIKTIVGMGTTVIEIVGKMVNIFGAMPTTIGIATASLMIFNREMYLGMTKNMPLVGSLNTKIISMSKSMGNVVGDKIINTFSKLSDGMTNATAKTATLKAGNVALGASMQMVSLATSLLTGLMTMGLSVAISAIAGSLLKMGDSLITTKSELAEMNSESMATIESNSNIISSVEKLISKEEELKNKLSQSGATYEEQTQYKESLLGVQRELAAILPESADAFDAEGNKISTNTDKVLANLDAKKKLSEQEAIKSIKKNDDYETTIDMPKNYEATKKQYEDMQKAYQLNENYMDREVTSKWLEKIEKKVNEYEEAIKLTSASVEALRSAGWEESRIAQELFKDMTLENATEWYDKLIPVIDNYNGSLQKTNEIVGSNSGANTDTSTQAASVEALQKSYESLGYSVEDAKKKVEELNSTNLDGGTVSTVSVEDATKAYGEALTKANEYQQMIDKINESSAMTGEIVTELASKYPELGAGIFSASESQDFLNNKIAEQANIQSEALQIMNGNSESYYQSQLANGNSLQTAFDQWASNFIDINSDAYTFDVNNYNNLNEAKVGAMNQLGVACASWLASFTGGNAQGYAHDLSQFTSLAEQKAYVLDQLNKEISKIQNNYNSLITEANSVIANSNSAFSGNDQQQEQMYARKLDTMKNKLNTLNGAYEQVNTSFSQFNKSFSGVSGNFATPSFSSGGGSGSSGGSGGSGSSATEKEVANVEELSDRYYDLNNALTKVENSLTNLHTEMENADDEKKMQLLKEEVKLLNNKKIALENLRREQQKQLGEDRKILSSSGFSFGSDGSITNAKSRLDALTARANSLTGEDKENAIAEVKGLATIVKSYTDMLLDTIPQITDDINDMKNETISAQKEMADIVAKQRDEYIKGLEKETDKLKSELDKRKDLMNKSWEDEDRQDSLAEKQSQLNDLEEQLALAMRTADEELIKSIRQQITAAQSEVDTFIRDNERDDANERFDKESEKLDEDLQNKIDKITLQLSDEEILKMVQSGVTDLSKVLDDITSSTNGMTSTFVGIGKIIEENWIGSLNTFMSGLDSMKNFAMNMSFTPSAVNFDGVGSKAITVSTGDLIIQGNVAEDILPKLNKMFESNNKQIIKTINDAMKN